MKSIANANANANANADVDRMVATDLPSGPPSDSAWNATRCRFRGVGKAVLERASSLLARSGSLAAALAVVAVFSLPPSVPGQDGIDAWQPARELCRGVRYARRETREPRPMIVHGVRIDTATPGLRLHTTSRRADWVLGKTETDRQTTRDFLCQSRKDGIPMVFAVNADAFSPWPAPYNKSTPTDLLGLAVADGLLVSRGAGTPSLVKRKAAPWRIETTKADDDTSAVELAVSGFGLCLDESKPIAGGADVHPRTGVGITADGERLIIVAIDGRQPESHGATTGELGEWLRRFGAVRGINMDGGGSTTFAWWDREAEGEDKCVLLNRPVGNGVNYAQRPPESFQATERANGNNLGVSMAD